MAMSEDGGESSSCISGHSKGTDGHAAISTHHPDRSQILLFQIPHARMKELVTWPLNEAAKALAVEDLEPSLQAIYEAMWELKTHEYIENYYIMDKLKARLQTKRVYNELVCNCHQDSKLLDVIRLVEKVYEAKTQMRRCKYGRKLQASIRTFVKEFVTHMEQEESIFQPLLEENFEPKELVDMKETVLRQHSLFREKVKNEKSLQKAVKRRLKEEVFDDLDVELADLRFRKSYCQEVKDHLKSQEQSEQPCAISQLPNELVIAIFAHLSPKDLLSCSAVCKSWNRLSFSSMLWQALYPTQWTRGVWSFDYIEPSDEDCEKVVEAHSLSSSNESLAMDTLSKRSSSSSLSSSAAATTSWEEISMPSPTARENRILNGIISQLLPKIGPFVSTLILSASKGLTSKHVKAMLKRLPNLRSLDLSYTLISSNAFAGLAKARALRHLEELDLSGCKLVGDSLLLLLARCYSSRSHLRKLSLSGCCGITSFGIAHLEIHSGVLADLDISGCYKVDGQTLSALVARCPRLLPQKLSYCNDIEDGPYPDSANGCFNLGCKSRFCCKPVHWHN